MLNVPLNLATHITDRGFLNFFYDVAEIAEGMDMRFLRYFDFNNDNAFVITLLTAPSL